MSRRHDPIKLLMASLAALLLTIHASIAPARDVYQQPRDFIDSVFADAKVRPSVLWLTESLQDSLREILGHPYPSLRLRYWQKDNKTAWILEETGKERPITLGIVIEADRIRELKVLVYRESRGSEIRYPFFTEQFSQLGLKSGLELNGHIDGISGATLSVRAVEKLARVALYLHRSVINET